MQTFYLHESAVDEKAMHQTQDERYAKGLCFS